MTVICNELEELQVLKIYYREKDGKRETVAMTNRKPIDVDLWEEIKKQMDRIMEKVF